MSKLSRSLAAAMALACFLSVWNARGQNSPEQNAAVEVRTVAEKAYLYAYPLVLMEFTRRSTTLGGDADKMNRFFHAPRFPDDRFRQVVLPNADTLYSTAWLDLSKQHVLLHVPDTHGRYYLMQLVDAWTETIAAPGKRTTGTAEGWFAIAGPGWKGTLPPGAQRIDCPTNTAWLVGRTQTNGPSDYEYVHAIQQGYKLVRLSSYPDAQAPLPDLFAAWSQARAAIPPPVQVQNLSAIEFFRQFAQLLQSNPPHAGDAAMIQELAKIGITPGKPFEPEGLGAERVKALEEGVQAASTLLASAERRAMSAGKNGWSLPGRFGRYGTDYLTRAFTARIGLGALPPEDAVYINCRQDAGGAPLNGAKHYVMHFQKSEIPPVGGFWSLTLYDEPGYFAANSLNRYAIGDRDALQFNADGSLDFYIQQDSPGDERQSNWLPAPAGNFKLFLRMYWPGDEVIGGRWAPPPVVAADAPAAQEH